MATVPQLATYTSEDKNFKIQITAANPKTGGIEYVYETTYSPEGPLGDSFKNGVYSWVHNDTLRKNDVPPFCLRFACVFRAKDFTYCIYDVWGGAYQEGNTLLLEGSRAYVNSKGVAQVTSLGALKFSQ